MDELTAFLSSQYNMSPEQAAHVAGNIVNTGSWSAYPGSWDTFQKAAAAPKPYRQLEAKVMTSEEIDKYFAGTSTAGPSDDEDALIRAPNQSGDLGGAGGYYPDSAQAGPSKLWLKHNEEIETVKKFFSPDATARRAKVPMYWSSPEGKARMAEMEKKRAHWDSPSGKLRITEMESQKADNFRYTPKPSPQHKPAVSSPPAVAKRRPPPIPVPSRSPLEHYLMGMETPTVTGDR